MKTDKITVVITNFNYDMFLREATQSVLNQTIKPKKLIFADDGCTDNSYNIESEYVASDPLFFNIVRQTPRQGLIKNLNNVSQYIDTEFVCFLAADDIMQPTYLEKALKIIEEKDDKLAIVYSDMEKFGNWSGIWTVSEWDPQALRQGNYINGHAILRTQMVREVGGYKETQGFEDHQLYVDMLDLNKGYYGVRIPEALIKYRRHDFGHRTDKTDINKRTK
jgi:glycosyltransferase involved in cell wall biosynthesis